MVQADPDWADTGPSFASVTLVAAQQSPAHDFFVNAKPTLVAIGNVAVNEGQTAQAGAVGTDAGDVLVYSLIGAPQGASINGASGAISLVTTDGPATVPLTVRATDRAGSFVERSFQVNVNNVAPQPAVSGAVIWTAAEML